MTSPNAGPLPSDPGRVPHAESIPVWPAVAVGLLGAGVVIGTIAGRVKGAVIGAVSAAAVGAWAFFQPERAEAGLAWVIDSIRQRTSTGTLTEQLKPKVAQYQAMLDTLPVRAGNKAEQLLHQVTKGQYPYQVRLAKSAVKDTLETHLKGRIILEGFGGGVSWALFRRRDTVAERLYDFGVGFLGGVLLEFPYHAWNAYIQDVTGALQRGQGVKTAAPDA